MSKPPHKSGGSKSGGFKSGGSGRGRPPGSPSRGGPSSGGSERRGRDERAGDARRNERGPGERSFGERGRSDRSASPRGDTPARGERSFGERGRSDRSAGPRGDTPARGERSFGERGRSDRSASPRGDAPARGERSFGERGRSDRSASPRGDAPARGERSFGERGRGDRPASPRGDAPARGERSFGERGRSDRTASPRGAFTPDHGERGRGEYSAGARADRSEGSFARPAPMIRKATHAAPRAAAPTARDPSLPARDGERIAKLLARAGIASRREAERLIEAGRVKLGDQVIDTPSTVLANLRGVTVDGNPVKDPEATRLFLFHKPAGLLTAERDPAGRPTIYTALRNALPENAGRVMPIGRLDLNTEGLLLLTNDGEFKRQLELPATGVPRTYRARTFGDISQPQLEQLMEGIEVDGVIYGQINANMERRTGRNQWIEMTLKEGKNREVRRVLEALGLQVSRLIRVSYGPFRLGDLPKGMAGEIAQKDLDNFRSTLPKAVKPESD